MSSAEPTPRVTIYGSSVSGNRKVKDAQTRATNALLANKIPSVFRDVAAAEQDKAYMRSKNNGATALPQFFTDGEFRGVWEQMEEAIEGGYVHEFLGLDQPAPSAASDQGA